jgi:hypothetical protein
MGEHNPISRRANASNPALMAPYRAQFPNLLAVHPDTRENVFHTCFWLAQTKY